MFRLVRQSLIQGVVPSAIGAVFGILITSFATRAIVALAFPAADFLPIDLGPGSNVLLFSFGLALRPRRARGHRDQSAGVLAAASRDWRDLQQLIGNFEKIPGVAQATYPLYTPMGGGKWSGGVVIAGRPPDQPTNASWNGVGPGYFELLGTRLIRGRGFDDRDLRPESPTAIINETFARRFFEGENPLGRRLGRGGARACVGSRNHRRRGGCEVLRRRTSGAPHDVRSRHADDRVRGAVARPKSITIASDTLADPQTPCARAVAPSASSTRSRLALQTGLTISRQWRARSVSEKDVHAPSRAGHAGSISQASCAPHAVRRAY